MTDIRVELSKDNPYYLPKHRYLELKHRCLQYGDWKKNYASSIDKSPTGYHLVRCGTESRPIESIANSISIWSNAMAEVDKVLDIVSDGNPELRVLLFKGIAHGLTFEKMKAQSDIFINTTRKTYYESYRKFFWVMDILRRNKNE